MIVDRSLMSQFNMNKNDLLICYEDLYDIIRQANRSKNDCWVRKEVRRLLPGYIRDAYKT